MSSTTIYYARYKAECLRAYFELELDFVYKMSKSRIINIHLSVILRLNQIDLEANLERDEPILGQNSSIQIRRANKNHTNLMRYLQLLTLEKFRLLHKLVVLTLAHAF